MIFFTRLGLILIGIQLLLTIFIPIFVKIFPSSCSIICIFSEEQGYFFLFNLPGIYLSSIPFISDFIMSLRTTQERLSGEITLLSNIITFLLSSIVYYFIGLGIETVLRKKLIKFKNRRQAILIIILGVFLSLISFIALAESFVKIAINVGQRLEQFQRCKNKNGYNTYEWKIFKYEFSCKNGLYDGTYKVYENGMPYKAYTYKNGKMICKNQYQCGKDLK